MKKTYIPILSLLAVATVVLGYYFLVTRETITPPGNTGGVNYGPPTIAETEDGDKIKDSQPIKTSDSSVSDTDSELIETAVVITDASQYGDVIEVRSFMPNVIETGECFIRFTKNNIVLEYVEPAVADASSTICVSQNVQRSSFSEAGNWQVEVSYKSDNYFGNKQSELEIK